jgi:16S rRNA (uracil1498-N3)-methyltransferase|tara:strand:- start:256 stop:972 length:717 start_codon:yes stop_codon:yes gene_type:complete
MRIPRLFLTDDIATNNILTLSDEQSHYLKNVLRRKNNDPIVVFNKQVSFTATIIYTEDKTHVMPIEQLIAPPTTTIKKHLFQAACQHKKMDFIIQKATELGIDTITPILTNRCKVNLKNNEHKAERWNQIAIEACRQSQRNTVPIINNAIKIADINIDKSACNLLLSPTSNKTLPSLTEPAGDFNIFIGPEGGFTDIEVNNLVGNGCHDIKFGPRIMRTETAAIAVIAAINVLWGDCK